MTFKSAMKWSWRVLFGYLSIFYFFVMLPKFISGSDMEIGAALVMTPLWLIALWLQYAKPAWAFLEKKLNPQPVKETTR
jgi:hypothetical protein